MPLVRTQVRNEYGLGNADLYLEPARRGDPKAILDGVAVSGLVGILRQLGDLAGFAADIFHDLHEQVAATSARSHKMMARVQRLETSFPAIEKNIHSLKGHVHLVYLPGSDWHSDAQIEHGHLLASELPRFLMDSYEECRDPPRLFLLDKFDSGGAGSCLRKYSDPTYFRRTWADLHIKEADRSTKERKRKKMKGLRMRNAEMLHVTSLPHRSDRTWFSSPSSDEGITAIDAVSSSVNAMRQRREVESDTESFDSRTSVVDMNPIPSASSSPELDQSSYEGMLGPNTKIQQHEHDSVRCDGSLVGVDDSLGSSREDKVPRYSSVTWDEKIELPLASNPKQLDIDLGEDRKNWISDSECLSLETDSSKLRVSIQEDNSVHTTSVPHQEKLQFSTGNSVSLPSSNGFCEEVNSEAENYVDALNSLESEAETDSEFQTKWEVKPVLSSGPTESTGSGESEKLASGSITSGGDTNTIPKSNLNNQASLESAESFASKDTRHLPSLPITGDGNAAAMVPERNSGERLVTAAPELHTGSEVNSIDNRSDAHNTYESHAHNEVEDLSSRSKLATSAHNIGDTHLGEETQELFKPSVEIWTNGGLLGLKPSKPPDFCTAGTVSQSPSVGNVNKSHFPECTTKLEQNDNFTKFDEGFRSKEIMWGKCSLKDIDELNTSPELLKLHMQESIDQARKQSFIDDHEHRSANIQVSVSQVPTDCKLEDSAESQSRNIFYDQPNKTRNNAAPVFDKQPEGFKVKRFECGLQEIDANHGLEESNTRLYGSSEKLNSTLFRLYPLSPPSPPLEHMKISFHPLNRTVTSKLKLEFTENHVDENADELTFPAFQLLPGPHVCMQHISSDSDDDTFCRSSRYSENVFSHHSDADSEIWEHDEQSLSGNDDTHDVANAVSSPASISSSLEHDGVKHNQVNEENQEIDSKVTYQENNGPSSLQSSHLLDIPGLESLNPSIIRHGINCNTGVNEIPDLTFSNQNEMPPLPPLPPLEWRKMKSTPVSGEFKNHLAEVLSQIKGKGSPNLTEPASVNGASVRKELVASMNGAQVGGRNGEKKIISPKTTNEREDFLQQIRNKSFNLRRTSVNRPSFMPEPVANIKVAAILEKANTIRQAFAGSDGGEDDNWSDG